MPQVSLQCVGGRGIGSELIKWFSAGDLSHVDGVFPAGLLGARSDWIKGVKPGVEYRPFGYETWDKRVIFTLRVSDAQYIAYIDWLEKQLHRPYDKPAIIGFAFGRNWRDEDSWYCSELYARALEVAGIVPRLYVAANKITPVALAVILSAVGARVHE